MKLIGIQFHGFKSFADSADIRFHDGITSIVGPNGCGKSNISDGLRWVLGEQRPTAIRGSRMEEAIFQGTERRKPIHRAEVTLRLSNDDHLLPVPYSEVEIARTVHTGGEGEYRLNGTLCRLRDIQDLCRDTGLGANAYAIIEGRMVDAILSDKAEERRAMFEEAAGIGRYKERRRVALRRLDEADADLARVDDVISEVQTKVRSLARQRGKARRYLEMRERKLALELGLARIDLTRLDQRHNEIAAELSTLGETLVEDAARLRSAEAEHETLRTRLADIERDRADSARKLMSVRDRLATREQERLLAEERARQAGSRLEQLLEERGEQDATAGGLLAEVERLREIVAQRRAVLSEMREGLGRQEVELAEVSERRQAMEAAEAAVESERQRYREERARLQASGEAARAEAAELARRLDDAKRRHAGLASTVEVAGNSEAETRRAAAAAQQKLERLSGDLADAQRDLARQQAEHEEARARQVALSERLQATLALIEDLRPLATGEQGFNPAVRAALERSADLGIRGILAQSLRVPEEFADGIEAFLGAYLEGLVVDGSEAVRRIRRWFVEEYDGPGGLVLLPLDRIPGGETDLRLPDEVRASGPGAAWVRSLLGSATLGDEPLEGRGAWIGRRESLDPLGAFRLGRPYAGGGLLARKAELERLEGQRSKLELERRQVSDLVEAQARGLAGTQERVQRLRSARRAAEEEAARLAARVEAVAERLARAREELVSAVSAMETLERERHTALRRESAEAAALQSLRPVGAEAVPDPEQLAAVRAEWEVLREGVAEARVEEARAAAAADRAERELRAQAQALENVRDRSERTGREIEELRASKSRSQDELESAARDLESLFAEQESSQTAARQMEERAEKLRRKADELESLLRRVQQEERSRSDRRHELELERTQIDAEYKRTRERLEDEWGRPFEKLANEVKPAEGEYSALRGELTEIAETLGRIGLVNMLAEQEYQDEKERLEFLESQRADLAKARDDLRETIREINETATTAFLETLEQVRVNFKRTFGTLFEGGECDVWLENPDDPLDSPVEISASPGGKRTQRIHLLSGGERALTALSLLFAIYLVKPSPFCVLDEVDAPLDETNIRRFVAMLEEFKSTVQFIVITHNPVTIEAADWIYGVTMEEPGVSKIVGVEFSDYARGAVA